MQRPGGGAAVEVLALDVGDACAGGEGLAADGHDPLDAPLALGAAQERHGVGFTV
jgi:hypothetical protein